MWSLLHVAFSLPAIGWSVSKLGKYTVLPFCSSSLDIVWGMMSPSFPSVTMSWTRHHTHRHRYWFFDCPIWSFPSGCVVKILSISRFCTSSNCWMSSGTEEFIEAFFFRICCSCHRSMRIREGIPNSLLLVRVDGRIQEDSRVLLMGVLRNLSWM